MASKARNRKNKKRGKSCNVETHQGKEIAGIVSLSMTVFLLLSLFSLQFGDGGLMGPLGDFFARSAYGFCGLTAYLACFALLFATVRMLLGHERLSWMLWAGMGLWMFSIAVLLQLVAADYRVSGSPPGGWVGEFIGEGLRGIVSTAGTVLIALVTLVLALVATTPLRLVTLLEAIRSAFQWLWAAVVESAVEVWDFLGDSISAILPERDEDEECEESEPQILFEDSYDDDDSAPVEVIGGDTMPVNSPEFVPMILAEEGVAPTKAVRGKRANGAASEAEPVIVESKYKPTPQQDMKAKEKEVNKRNYIPLGDGVYELPPISLLTYDDTRITIDRDAMKELAARLTETFANYKIMGEVQAIRPGPVVTMYEFAPAPGTRVSKISNLADDLAMSLEAFSVRIIAPIPGKAVVGIEVPNKRRETVFLKEIIAADCFQKSKSNLALAVGKDNEGRPVSVDLAKMPHLLVAGTTGAGKSVSVNTMITSILYSATPEEVRMIMVDPKMLELSIYEGIPHLLLPVVTDPKKANLALRWAVEEMERRYQLMAESGVKDLHAYNRKVERTAEKLGTTPSSFALEDTEELQEEDFELAVGTDPSVDASALEECPRKLPQLVIIIDEFADLMMCAAKEVEHSVTRLAQKARACGIHLILATQRPTTEVITGLIKSNIPSRMAFRVTNKTNSIAVLEQSGAEALLGQGDMLFSDRGQALQRVHGCLVQDAEIEAVVAFLKKQAKPVYDLDILKPRDENGEVTEDDEPADAMYDKAVALVAEKQQASVSMIQRHLRVGYNRAARMVDKMERDGIVAPADGPGRREVLIQSQ